MLVYLREGNAQTMCCHTEKCVVVYKVFTTATRKLKVNAPATCYCISGADLLRQVYVLPH